MNYLINNYRAKKVGCDYFLTTDHGSYCILSKEEFINLKNRKIGSKLKKKLEKSEIIINEKNAGEAERLLRERYSFLFSGTTLHIIVVTLRCNMNCIYCQASAQTEKKAGIDMDKETAKKTVDFIFQSTSKRITIEFQGGEPLINWGIIKYITEYSKKKKKTLGKKGSKKELRLAIVTNMSCMDREKMDFLIKHGFSVCTSLDGPKKVHDYNRVFSKGSSYDSVTEWIKRFNDEYKKRGIKNRVSALVTLTKKSLCYPKEIVDEYVKNGINRIHLRSMNNLGAAKKKWGWISYTADEYLEFWKKAVKYIEELKKRGVGIEERMVNIIFNKINNEFDPNYLDLRSPCGAAIGQLAYNFNGDIYTCDEARMIDDDMFLLGNVKKDNYKKILTCNKTCAVVNASINDQYKCDNCAFKPYCGLCPVCNYSEQGNIITNVSETDRCKIFMEQFKWVVKEKFIKKKAFKKKRIK